MRFGQKKPGLQPLPPQLSDAWQARTVTFADWMFLRLRNASLARFSTRLGRANRDRADCLHTSHNVLQCFLTGFVDPGMLLCFSRLELQLRVLFVCSGPLVLTTSKILSEGSGFPELQIPRFQKRRFQLPILPCICGVSPLVLFRHVFLKVAMIPYKFQWLSFVNLQNLNIRQGLMQKLTAIFRRFPEIAKYVDKMKGSFEIIEIY